MSGTDVSTDIIGRKIFFLYPTVSVQNQIITELVQHEFEVYTAKNHSHLATVLTKNPGSVVFVNIDEGMPKPEWDKWISGVMTSAPDTKIGIFTSDNSEELHEKYAKDPNIKCGCMSLKVSMTKGAETIIGILNSFNVKGRRKYVRATIDHDANATMNMPSNTGYDNAVIKDISVVGISCVFESDPGLSKNSLCKDIQIKLQSTLLKVDAIVYGSRTADTGEKIYVLLFTQRMDPDSKVKIRKYIQQSLQNKMASEIN